MSSPDLPLPRDDAPKMSSLADIPELPGDVRTLIEVLFDQGLSLTFRTDYLVKRDPKPVTVRSAAELVAYLGTLNADKRALVLRYIALGAREAIAALLQDHARMKAVDTVS